MLSMLMSACDDRPGCWNHDRSWLSIVRSETSRILRTSLSETIPNEDPLMV